MVAVSRDLSEPRGRDFVARTIAGVTGSLEQAVFSEESARLPGLLQRVDARAKVAAGLVLLITAGIVGHLAVLAALHALTLLLAAASRLSVASFAGRAWVGVPLFAGLVVLPSLFLAPGQPVLILWDAPAFRLAVTDNGLAGAGLMVARVGTSVSLVLLLVSTTAWAQLLHALRVLRVPAAFLVVLGMTYRYIFLFLHATNNLLLARASRTVGRTTGAEQRRWAATATGVLVSRSVKLSGDVLLAMQARGFGGEMRALGDRSMRDEDWLLLALGTVTAAALLLLDHLLV